MKLFEYEIIMAQIMLIPTIGVVKRNAGIYNYKYRIAFAWMWWRFSVGIAKTNKEAHS